MISFWPDFFVIFIFRHFLFFVICIFLVIFFFVSVFGLKGRRGEAEAQNI